MIASELFLRSDELQPTTVQRIVGPFIVQSALDLPSASNLDALLERRYPQSVLKVLSVRESSLSFIARRALVASILNAVRSNHGTSGLSAPAD